MCELDKALCVPWHAYSLKLTLGIYFLGIFKLNVIYIFSVFTLVFYYISIENPILYGYY